MAAPRDPCALVTPADFAAITGLAVEARPVAAGPTETACEYWGLADAAPRLGIRPLVTHLLERL